MQPKVSIIIPVYNSEKFIASSISSIIDQTYRNKEIIIVDDGSTDSSLLIAKTFESEICRVISQVNSGAAIARNTGLAHAKGDYIQFLDVDDFLSKDKIEKQIKALNSQFNKVAVCDYIEFFNENELTSITDWPKQSDFIYSTDSPVDFLINLYGGHGKSNFIQTNCWLTPRSIIDKIGEWRSYIWLDDDGEYFARVLLASEGIVHVPGVYNFYRRSASKTNLSNSKEKIYIKNALLAIDLKYQYLLQFTDSAALHRAMATQYLNFAVFHYPGNKVVSNMAYKKFKSTNSYVKPPKLGGDLIELVKKVLGWKAARLLKYYLREK